jgi:spermidine/putrescine transport system substrate-binding protein
MHPKERRPPRTLSRREFLRRSAGTAVALSGGAAFLAACGHASNAPPPAQQTVNPTSAGGSPGSELPYPLARPDNPVKWPIYDDNPPIGSGMNPEQGATLQLFNWADYIWKKVVNDFAAKYNCKVQITTFDNTDEFLSKMRTGTVPYDVCWPTPDQMGKLVTAKLIQPINHDYVSNLSNVWASLQNPYYDQGSQYTVPYTVYSTGIAYRTDRVHTDPGDMPNPYEIFWDSAYSGKTYILDDYRESTGMVLLKNGGTDINSGDPAELDKAKQDLLAMIDATNVKYDVNDYTEIPEGRATIHQGWSGDMISAQYYLPKGVSTDVIGYWYPQDRGGVVGSDIMAIPTTAKNPVLAHLFLNYMLDNKVAYSNFYNFNGYQPPLNSIDVDRLLGDAVPTTLPDAIVRPEDFERGYLYLELAPSVDAMWHSIWQQFQAGA